MLQTTKTITASPPATTVNADGTISCQECGERHKALHRHVLKHGLTSVMYQTKYPGAPLVAPGVQIGRPPKVETNSPPSTDANKGKSVSIGTKLASRDGGTKDSTKGKREQAKDADLDSLETAAITAWSNLDRHLAQAEDSDEACSYLMTIYAFVRAAILDPDGFRTLNRAGGKRDKVKAPRAGTANAQYLHATKYVYAAMSNRRKLERKRAAEEKRKEGDGRTTAWRYAKAFRWCGEKDMTAGKFKAALAKHGVYGLAEKYDIEIFPKEKPDRPNPQKLQAEKLETLKRTPILTSGLRTKPGVYNLLVVDADGLRGACFPLTEAEFTKVAKHDMGTWAFKKAFVVLSQSELEIIAKALASTEATAERDSAAQWVAEGLRSLEGNDAQPTAQS